MPNITWASCGKKVWCIASAFHACNSWSMHGIHLSFQIWTFAPLPIFHRVRSRITSFVAIILYHAKEGHLPSYASKNVSFAKYLALKTGWNREFWFCMRCQPCFAKRARMKAFKSLKPMLHSTFGLQSLSQAIQGIFLFIFLPPPESTNHGAKFSTQ